MIKDKGIAVEYEQDKVDIELTAVADLFDALFAKTEGDAQSRHNE